MNLIIESQYLAPVIAYKMSIQISNVEFELYEHYRKMSFRNRCVVMGAHGPITLSVPLEDGRDQRLPFREIRVANRQNWQSQHWKTITSCYNRSPWFEYYRDELEELYREPFSLLIDWNMACWGWMTRQLGLSVKTSFTDAYHPYYDENEYVDFRNKLLPKSINHEFPQSIKYQQVFEERTGFVPHCSILDLLFCEGKNAQKILMDAQDFGRP